MSDLRYHVGALHIGPIAIAVLLGIVLLLGAFMRFLLDRPPINKHAPPLTTHIWPIVGALGFFTRRAEWVKEARADSKSGHFSFYAGQTPVVGLCGLTEEPRKLFFEDRRLGFYEGYEGMLSGAPSAESNKMATGEETTETQAFIAKFKARLTAMMKGDKLDSGLPELLRDVKNAMDALAAEPKRITNPFDSIFRIVYQLTMRNVGCKDVADDPKLLANTLYRFEQVESAANAAMIIFPWLPMWSKLKRMYDGVRLYLTLKKLVETRQKEGRRENDAVQYLLDQGDSVTDIIQFVVAAVFSGQLNTGINASWIIVCLAQHPEWQARIREEVHAVADKYDCDESLPLAKRLFNIPFAAWDEDFPMIFLCLRETIRLTLPGTYFRRNKTNDEIPIPSSPGLIIPGRSYVALPVGDMHHNAEIFQNSDQWDPSRYFPERAEDKKQTYAWTGWGHGRHPCLGTRFARLETSIIIAFFVASFDSFIVSDKNGRPVDHIPTFNKNNFSAKKPDTKVYVRYQSKACKA